MKRSMKRHIGTFTAWDGKARRYTIHHYIESDAGSTAKPHATAGGHAFRTSDGRDVRRISKGSYVIVDPLGDVPVHSDSPDAF